MSFPVSIELPVQWGDMDAYGHVNNVVYLRWCESARLAFGVRCGLTGAGGELTAGIGPILARQAIDYRLPVRFPDTVGIDVGARAVGRTSFTLALRVRSRAAGDAVAAEVEAVLVLFDYGKGAAVPLPDALRARLDSLRSPA